MTTILHLNDSGGFYGTNAVVKPVAIIGCAPISLFRQIPMHGKTAGPKTLVPETTRDIVLFSDANSQWYAQASNKSFSTSPTRMWVMSLPRWFMQTTIVLW